MSQTLTRQPTGGHEVSVAVYDSAAAALRRAGYEPTRSRVRLVVRAQQETGVLRAYLMDQRDRSLTELRRCLSDRLSRRPPVGLLHVLKEMPQTRLTPRGMLTGQQQEPRTGKPHPRDVGQTRHSRT